MVVDQLSSAGSYMSIIVWINDLVIKSDKKKHSHSALVKTSTLLLLKAESIIQKNHTRLYFLKNFGKILVYEIW